MKPVRSYRRMKKMNTSFILKHSFQWNNGQITYQEVVRQAKIAALESIKFEREKS